LEERRATFIGAGPEDKPLRTLETWELQALPLKIWRKGAALEKKKQPIFDCPWGGRLPETDLSERVQRGL